MARRIFDYSDGVHVQKISDNMAVDCEGDLLMRLGDTMAMDMENGDIHFVSSWSDDEED